MNASKVSFWLLSLIRMLLSYYSLYLLEVVERLEDSVALYTGSPETWVINSRWSVFEFLSIVWRRQFPKTSDSLV